MSNSPSTAGPAGLTKALEALRSGGQVVLPTETFFGLACDATDAEAVARIYQSKGRDATKPLPLVAASPEMVARFCDLSVVPEALLSLWPGPLTMALRATASFPAPLLDALGRVAIRVSPHPVPTALSEALGRPLTATSANRQGQPPARFARDLDPVLLANGAVLLDLPPVPPGGLASTIIAFPAPGAVRLLREGPVAMADLERLGLEVLPAGAARR